MLLLCLFMVFSLTSLSSAAAKEINFWLMPNAPNDDHVAWLNQHAAEFMKETGIKVNFTIVGWGDAWPKLTAAFTSGEGPDVFQAGTTWNPQFAAMGGLAPVDVKEFGGVDAFMPANYESTTYKKKCFGVPWFAETRALFYNVDTFKELGLKPPQTLDELVAAGKAITKAKGAGSAIAIAGNQAWDLLHNWTILLWANGGKLINDANTKAVFNGPEGVKAMTWYVDLFQTGLAAKACAEYNQPQADSAFAAGNVAMAYMGPWNVATVQHDNPKLNFAVAEPPAGPKGRASFSGGSNLVILASSKKQAEARAWIKFLLRKEILVDYCKNVSNMLPAMDAAFEDPAFNTGHYKVFKKTLSYATAYPPLGTWGSIENAIVGEFKNILTDYVTGKLKDNGIKQRLDIAAERVDAALKDER